MTSQPPGYEILESLGQGAMGQVYRARQTALNREVALKITASRYGHDQVLMKRFAREARATARVSHPNLIQIFDFGTVDDRPFLAMELIDGEDLLAVYKSDPGRARNIAHDAIRDALAAVSALHAQRLVHRDLKLANLMVEDSGRIVVMDLGLVKDLDAKGTILTQVGDAVGTPFYMSPEVLHGQAITPAADVWSIGCIWFQLLAGRYLYQRPTFDAHLRAIATEPLPDLEAALPDLDPDRRTILARCLDRDPTARFPDAGAVLAALERALDPDAPTIATRGASPRQGGADPGRPGGSAATGRMGRGLTLGALVTLVVLGLGTLARPPGGDPTPPPPSAGGPARPTPSISPRTPAVDQRTLVRLCQAFPAHIREARAKGSRESPTASTRLLSTGTTPGDLSLMDDPSGFLFESGDLIRRLGDTWSADPDGSAGGSSWFLMFRVLWPIRQTIGLLRDGRRIQPMAFHQVVALRNAMTRADGRTPRDLFARWLLPELADDPESSIQMSDAKLDALVPVAREAARIEDPRTGPPRARLAEIHMIEHLVRSVTLPVELTGILSDLPGGLPRLRDRALDALDRLDTIAGYLEARPPESFEPEEAYGCVLRALDQVFPTTAKRSEDRQRIPEVLRRYHRLYQERGRRRSEAIWNLERALEPALARRARITSPTDRPTPRAPLTDEEMERRRQKRRERRARARERREERPE